MGPRVVLDLSEKAEILLPVLGFENLIVQPVFLVTVVTELPRLQFSCK
jgi:hypothetical protein